MNDKDLIYQGKIITLNLEKAKLPNGKVYTFEIVKHPGGATVVALDKNIQVCLLKHYRHTFGDWLWELPAGKIDNNEAPIETAKRELLEETGIKAGRWIDLGEIISSPGVFTEQIYVYLARELDTSEPRPEDGEVYKIHWIPFQKALNWAVSGEIKDAKTIIGLFRTQQRLSESGACSA